MSEESRQTPESPYAIEMLGITKIFPGIIANDDITLQLKHGEIHALLGENGAGKSTLMSVLFGLYQPEKGEIRKDGKPVVINDPNDANALGIGMVHQHFKLVEVFSVLDNIILGNEPGKFGFIKKSEARERLMKLSSDYGLGVDPDAKVEDITVGMQQRTEILKMLYRENEILIFDEPTAVLTPQEIAELMQIIRGLAKEGKSILFISHKLNEILEKATGRKQEKAEEEEELVQETVIKSTLLRKGRCVGTVNIADTTKEELSSMMVGRDVSFTVDKAPAKPGRTVLGVENLSVRSRIHKTLAVKGVSCDIREGEIVCIAGIDGNGQSEMVYALTGLEKAEPGSTIRLLGEDVSKKSIRYRNTHGMAHIPEDRHKHGLVLDYSLAQNLALERYFEPRFQHLGLIKDDEIVRYAETLIDEYDVRSGEGPATPVRSMSGGNQQKAIIARELDREHKLLIAVQPTRGLDVGAIESIHRQIVAARDAGHAVLLISFELDEVMNLADRILVMFNGEITGEFDPASTDVRELGLYMAVAKRSGGKGEEK